MLRSEPRLNPDVLDDLDRLDAALHADRHGAADASADPYGDVGGTPSHRSDGPTAADAPDDLDRDLLDLVAAVRTTRPALDAGARMRLDERVEAAKAAPAPRASRFTADRRWRAGLALAAVVAVAIPVGAVVLGSQGETSGTVASSQAAASPSLTTRQSSGSGAASDSAASSSGSAAESTATTEGPSAGTADSAGGFSRQSAPSATTSDSDSATADSVAPGPDPVEPPLTKQAPLGAPRQVIRDVEQTVRINPGDVAKSAQRVTTIVQDAGGYLGSSEVRERGSAAGGTFQVVVPTGRLDATVAALSKIGRPVRLERSSSDVTDQATSLDDQLEDLRADRAAARLALAKTVDPDKRAARRRELNLLSSRVAALKGQRDQLRSQTSTSRIDLRLTTSRNASDDPAPVVDDGSWGIGDAWDDAGRVLEVGGGVLLIGGVIVVPLAGLLGLGLVLRRRAAARGRDQAIDAA